jgi:hypothetical protein
MAEMAGRILILKNDEIVHSIIPAGSWRQGQTGARVRKGSHCVGMGAAPPGATELSISEEEGLVSREEVASAAAPVAVGAHGEGA